MTTSLAPVLPLTSSAATTQPRQRKVLHFIPTIGGGGAENFMRSLIAGMKQTHWQPVVLAANVHPHEAFAEQLRALGCSVIDLKQPALLKPALWLAVRKVIARERPDVVQTWMHHADFIGGLAALLAGVRNVVWGVRATEIHKNPEDSALKFRLFNHALHWGSRLLPSRIIANSTTAINVHCNQLGYPRHKMIWVPNGVNAERFAPSEARREQTREALGISMKTPVVGFVGRFHRVKDIETLFRMAALVQADMPQTHFVLVGGTEADLYPEARAAFEALPQRDTVHFIPFGSATEHYYPAFDAFTLCSRSEALPNVVLEAMATGVPCATTNAGDCATMLRDLGKVVPVGDHEALARAVMQHLTLPADKRAALALCSRERALRDYTMERAAARFAGVYDELVTSI